MNFSPTLNVFEGGNSQGKTNLVEAIGCLGQGASFRTSEDQRLIRWEQDSFYLGGEGKRKDNFLTYELSLAKNSKNLRRVNSHRVSLKNTNYWLWMVVFSAQDLKIIQGGPFQRRNFLDEVSSFIYPNFSYLRFSFNQVLNQRNFLLSRMKEKRNSYSKQMVGWDSQLLEIGSELVYLRLEGLKKLAASLSKLCSSLMGLVCSVHLTYTSSFLDAGDLRCSLEKMRKKFGQKLNIIREKEIERGVTLIGPHRDDFQITVDGVDQRIYGSQGEQRMVVIALRLAEIEIIKEKENEFPIILLDDIPSDLDPQREKFLLEVVKNKGQIFVATQDIDKFDQGFLDDSLIFNVKNGKVISR